MCKSRILVAVSALLTLAHPGCHKEPERIRQGMERRAAAISNRQALVAPPMYSDEDAVRIPVDLGGCSGVIRARVPVDLGAVGAKRRGLSGVGAKRRVKAHAEG